MEKVKVKLNTRLDKAGLGFFDISNGKKIAPKNFGKGESFEVENTDFIQQKLQSAELILIEKESEENKEETKTK